MVFRTGTVTRVEYMWCPKIQFQHVQKKGIGEYCEGLLTAAVQPARTVSLAGVRSELAECRPGKEEEEEPALTLCCHFVSINSGSPHPSGHSQLASHHHLQM